MIKSLTAARLRGEQIRFILDAASTKTDDAILCTAKEKHKQLMGEYGPAISSAISPGRKRETKDSEAFLRRTLKKVRRSSGAISPAVASTVPSKSSCRVRSESYSGADTVSNSVVSPDPPILSTNSTFAASHPL
jgi:hypothetical protein